MSTRTAALLFIGSLFCAAGYGGTFILTVHFAALGGSDADAGYTLGCGVFGTFAGVLLVGWLGPRWGAAKLAAAGGVLLAAAYLILASLQQVSLLIVAVGILLGMGWGAFYLAAPMSVSERSGETQRGAWLSRLGAFQMAGIGASPVLAAWLLESAGLPTASILQLLAGACMLGAASVALFDYSARFEAAPRLPARRSTALPGTLAALARSRARYPVLMVFLGACVFSGLMTFQSSLVQGTRLRPETYFVVYSLVVVGARLAFASALARANADALACALLAAMTGGVLCMFALDTGLPAQLASAMLVGAGYGLAYMVLQAQVLGDVPQAQRGVALTCFVLAYFAGVFGFPALGGWLLLYAGRKAFLCVVLACAIAELALAVLRWRAGLAVAGASGLTAGS